MDGVNFVKGLSPEMVYIIGFDPKYWDGEQIGDFMKLARESGLNAIGVSGDGVTILEPIGIEKEKLKELLGNWVL